MEKEKVNGIQNPLALSLLRVEQRESLQKAVRERH